MMTMLIVAFFLFGFPSVKGFTLMPADALECPQLVQVATKEECDEARSQLFEGAESLKIQDDMYVQMPRGCFKYAMLDAYFSWSTHPEGVGGSSPEYQPICRGANKEAEYFLQERPCKPYHQVLFQTECDSAANLLSQSVSTHVVRHNYEYGCGWKNSPGFNKGRTYIWWPGTSIKDDYTDRQVFGKSIVCRRQHASFWRDHALHKLQANDPRTQAEGARLLPYAGVLGAHHVNELKSALNATEDYIKLAAIRAFGHFRQSDFDHDEIRDLLDSLTVGLVLDTFVNVHVSDQDVVAQVGKSYLLAVVAKEELLRTDVARRQAEEAERKAQAQRVIAEAAHQKAEEQRMLAEEAHQQTEVQRVLAVEAKREAEAAKNESDEQRERAEIAKQEAETLRTQAETNLNCSKEAVELSDHVSRLVKCNASILEVPHGVATTNLSGVTVALRCPNPAACDIKLREENGGCSPGYTDPSRGCTTCASGYGRTAVDPFVCALCGDGLLPIFPFFGMPLILFGLGMRSAKKAGATKSRMAMILKITMAFGTAISAIMGTTTNSAAKADASQLLNDLLNATQYAVESSSGSTYTSPDCNWFALYGSSSRPLLRDWIALAAFPPFILIPSVGVLVSKLFIGQPGRNQVFAVHTFLVWSNCFLPGLCGALLKVIPCIHYQAIDPVQYYMAYMLEETCTWSDMVQRYVIASAGVLAFLAVGPAAWIALIRWSHQLEKQEQKEMTGFLTSGFNESCWWWEATVLTRKAMFVGVATLCPSSYSPMSSQMLVMAIGIGSLVMQLTFRPYEDDSMNCLESATLIVVLVAAMLAMLSGSYQWSHSKNTTRSAFIIFVMMVGTTMASLLLYYARLQLASIAEAIANRRSQGHTSQEDNHALQLAVMEIATIDTTESFTSMSGKPAPKQMD